MLVLHKQIKTNRLLLDRKNTIAIYKKLRELPLTKRDKKTLVRTNTVIKNAKKRTQQNKQYKKVLEKVFF